MTFQNWSLYPHFTVPGNTSDRPSVMQKKIRNYLSINEIIEQSLSKTRGGM